MKHYRVQLRFSSYETIVAQAACLLAQFHATLL